MGATKRKSAFQSCGAPLVFRDASTESTGFGDRRMPFSPNLSLQRPAAPRAGAFPFNASTDAFCCSGRTS
jgi:hypothetical protein